MKIINNMGEHQLKGGGVQSDQAVLLLLIHFMLMTVWLTCSIVYEFNVRYEEIILTYSAIDIAQSIVFIFLNDKNQGVSGFGLFYFSSAFFTALMPAIAAINGYHFIIEPDEMEYVVKIVKIVFLLNLGFYFGYLIGGGIKRRSAKVKDVCSLKIILKVALIALMIGAVAIFAVMLQVSEAIMSGDYVKISVSLRGYGWLVRLAELLAISGILIFILGKERRRKDLMWLGFILVVLFALFRLPMQNRENMIKYFIIMLLAYHLYKPVMWRPVKLLIFYIGFSLLLLVIPLTTSLRAPDGSGSAWSMYEYYLIRDLNFSEVASAIMLKVDSGSSIGIIDGLKRSLSILIPREIWPEKPYPISVELTSWVANIKSYDVYNPGFSYAPMYIGFGYSLGGYIVVCLLVFGSGFFIGKLNSHAKQKIGGGRIICATLSSIVIYNISFSFHKIEPGLILSAIILPVIYLYFSLKIVGLKSFSIMEPLSKSRTMQY